MIRVVIPHLSANVTDATLTRWLCARDERVRAGAPLAELTTEKAAFELEAPADGQVLELFAPVGSILPVGYIIALLGEPGQSDPAIEGANRQCLADTRMAEGAAEDAAEAAANGPAPLHPQPPPAPTGRVRATPKARRLAREHGLDLDAIQSASGADVVTEAHLKPFLDRS